MGELWGPHELELWVLGQTGDGWEKEGHNEKLGSKDRPWAIDPGSWMGALGGLCSNTCLKLVLFKRLKNLPI